MQASAVGPAPIWSYTGNQYNASGVSVGTVPAIHGDKGVWCGPGYTNLFSDPVAEQTKTLTAQNYTVWCDTGSVVCGAYGTATAETPLTFTATAGSCTFTPTGVTQWMLTATAAPMPYVPPGTTVASAAGTSGGNGIGFDMATEPDGVELVYNGEFDTSVDGWSKNLNGVLAWDSGGKLSITRVANTGDLAFQAVGCVVGAKYRVSLKNDAGVGYASVFIGIVGNPVGGPYYQQPTFGTAEYWSFDFVATAATHTIGLAVTNEASGTRTFDNISVQRLTSPLMQCFEKTLGPATCTVAAEVTMGVGSEAPAIVKNVLSPANNDVTLSYSDQRVAMAYDGTGYAFGDIDTWSRNEQHLKIVQTNALGTQFRVGNLRRGIDSAIQWSAWANFDGSFNPLTHLRLVFNNITTPIWIKGVQVWNTGQVSESDILRQFKTVGVK